MTSSFELSLDGSVLACPEVENPHPRYSLAQPRPPPHRHVFGSSSFPSVHCSFRQTLRVAATLSLRTRPQTFPAPTSRPSLSAPPYPSTISIPRLPSSLSRFCRTRRASNVHSHTGKTRQPSRHHHHFLPAPPRLLLSNGCFQASNPRSRTDTKGSTPVATPSELVTKTASRRIAAPPTRSLLSHVSSPCNQQPHLEVRKGPTICSSPVSA